MAKVNRMVGVQRLLKGAVNLGSLIAHSIVIDMSTSLPLASSEALLMRYAFISFFVHL
jgi:hypothetical protein